MRLRNGLLVILAFVFTLCAWFEAYAETTEVRPKLSISPKVSIRAEELTLGEIAQIESAHEEFTELVNLLKGISFGKSPAPRMKMQIPGAKILAEIDKHGIPRDAYGYSIPTSVEIEREGRIITNEEVLNLARSMFTKDPNLDLQVRDVSWEHEQVIPGGQSRLQLERLGEPYGGKMPLRIQAFVDEKLAARFLATALVDDWRAVPVLNKTMERGMLISSSDIEIVRLNLFKQSPDIAAKPQDVLGRRVMRTIQAGTTIRKSEIDTPPMIAKGKLVKMVFKDGGFIATATGVALEDGFEKSAIRVKNERSQRVVSAKVINDSEVEVESR